MENKGMNKIEKVKKKIYLESESVSIRELYEVINKLNEIIDFLNQSQKQPSGWIETDRWEKAKPVWTKKNQEQFEALIKKANSDEKDKSVHDKLSKLLKRKK